MLVKLKEIMEWITHQSHFLFTSSSILLMYDGSVESAAKENLADVRMIDFAHCFTMNPRDPDHDRIKKSYHSGLGNLIRILEEIKAEVSTPTVFNLAKKKEEEEKIAGLLIRFIGCFIRVPTQTAFDGRLGGNILTASVD